MRFPATVPVIAALALTAAACSSGATTSAEPRKARPITPVAGCGAGSWSDPAELAQDRKPARCDKGTPAARPLARKTKITVAASTGSAEFVAPVKLGIANGEFGKENLEVEFKQLGVADSIPLLAKGEVDAIWSAPEAAFFNGIDQGFELRWVLGNFAPGAGSKSGLWARVPQGTAPDALKFGDGTPVGTLIGKGSVIMYPMREVLRKHGTDLKKVRFTGLGGPADVVTALDNGGVKAAWVVDPLWKQLDGKPGMAFLGGQPHGEPLGGMIYGPSMLRENPDAGVAFVRALIRIYNTYFAGDYKKDPALIKQLSSVLGLKPEILNAVPSSQWDWEIRKDTAERLQQAFIEGGALGKAVPESEAVDRTLYAEAVGHKP
ncbi:ABC transporter substrate-binding protein [Spirillospora sp. CA-128828]|uniref:ABC transporter substrate-binding protein n=1 Tax=Spirillospora sp. CA-128828 TaxID=3240033 RepID=UPI003D8EC4B1